MLGCQVKALCGRVGGQTTLGGRIFQGLQQGADFRDAMLGRMLVVCFGGRILLGLWFGTDQFLVVDHVRMDHLYLVYECSYRSQ